MRPALLTLTLALVAASACDAAAPLVRVESTGSGDQVLAVEVELALTAEDRALGLRGRAPLADTDGLLIELPRATEVCIVNDGVAFAIDAVYAADDGAVVRVERAIAAGNATARCERATRRVLEVAAGVADAVAVGDRLTLE
jgi:uncharacterized membrane protein (UPF0127 family)